MFRGILLFSFGHGVQFRCKGHIQSRVDGPFFLALGKLVARWDLGKAENTGGLRSNGSPGYEGAGPPGHRLPDLQERAEAAAALLPGGSPGSCSLVKQKTLGTQLLVQIRTWKKFRAEAELFSLTAGPQERVSIQRRITLKKPNAERVQESSGSCSKSLHRSWLKRTPVRYLTVPQVRCLQQDSLGYSGSRLCSLRSLCGSFCFWRQTACLGSWPPLPP